MIILKLIAYCLTALMTLALLWTLGWMWYAASIVSMKPQHLDRKTDAIIVLTGGDKRVNTGIDLLAGGKAGHLFISGVNTQVKKEELVALWKDHSGEKNKDEDILCCITLGYIAESTNDNAFESQEWIKENNISSIRLVTANYHMTRSKLLFSKAMPDLIIYDHPVAPGDFEPWTGKFWALTFQEYNKLLATWLRLDQVDKNPSLENDSLTGRRPK